MNNRRPAFALIELCAVVIVCVGLLALAQLAADHSRRLGRVGEDLSHLRQIAASTSSYGGDFEDRTWQFSWKAGQVYWSPTDPSAAGFTVQSTDMRAALQQMTFLIRTRGGRSAIEAPNLAQVALWPYMANGHLVLIDYLDLPMPHRVFVSATDPRLPWANDPRGYDMGLYLPNLGVGGYNYRHPYGSSYRM
jgi:hypothetical protein